LRTEALSRRRGERGFTLIEVVVAFVLLALVLSVSFEIFTTGMTRASDLDDRARALVVAQSRLAAAGAEEPLKEGAASGQSDDRRFQWTLTVRRADDEAMSPDGTHPSGAYALYRVDVHVAWRGADSRDRALDLATLSVGPKPT
jgi:general secretion pathway protein I